MRLLFTIDTKDYDINGTKFIRPSSRAIIIKDNLVAMVHSIKYDYYKFPGGGIEANESKIEALIRETKEESGLIIIPSSIKEYGYVHRIQKSDKADVFIQDNYYYLCEVEEEIVKQKLDDYESNEKFTLPGRRVVRSPFKRLRTHDESKPSIKRSRFWATVFIVSSKRSQHSFNAVAIPTIPAVFSVPARRRFS